MSDKDNKLRILCLHGRGTDNDILRFQLGPLISSLRSQVHFEFLQGQQECGPAPGVHELFKKPKYFGYMNKRQVENQQFVYDGMNDAIEYMIEYLKEQKFDGWIGFSQGANLMAMVYAHLKQSKKIVEMPKFMVIFCGSQFGWAEHESVSDLFQHKLDIQSLHVIGKLDDYRPGSIKLTELFDEGRMQIIHHSGDHRPLPRDAEERNELINTIKEFILKHS